MIIGHEKNTTYLEHLVLTNAQVSSFLFFGKEHLGKTTVAEWFIKKLLRSESLANHPDFIRVAPEIDPKTGKKSAIGVETLRETLPRLQNSPIVAPHNILLIEEAEYIQEEGWNLMLKTLEEPSRSAMIILVAHSIQDIPKTVLSRVLKLQFFTVPEKELINGLEALHFSPERIASLLPLSLGRPGALIAALESKDETSTEETNQLLEVLERSFAERLVLMEQKSKDELREVLNTLELVCRDALLVKNECADYLVFKSLRQRITTLSNRFDNEEWQLLVKHIREAKGQLSHNANPRLVIENILFAF